MSKATSNPTSTGGGGQFFEAKVQAALVAMLLIGGRIPCAPTGRATSIRLQARQAGFTTDDAVVTVASGVGANHRLLVQIKRHATVSRSDTEFRDALGSAWTDFKNPAIFDETKDAIALITGPQSDRAIQHVRPILDWAKTTSTAAEYFSKVATPKFASDEKRAYLEIFRNALTDVSGGVLTDDELWRFLRVFHFLSYDFDTEHGKDESTILTVLDLARSAASLLDAKAIWNALIEQTQVWNRTAGTFNADSFSQELRDSVQPGKNLLTRFEQHSVLNLATISASFVPGFSLSRQEVVDVLVEAIESSGVVMVQGAPGSGKSAAIKLMTEAYADRLTTFVFKAQEFNSPHLHQFLQSIGVPLTFEQVRAELSLLPRKLLVLDGAERLLELANYDALRQLLSELAKDPSWTVLVTCREAAAEAVREHLFSQWNISTSSIAIPVLTDADLQWVVGKAPHLSALIANPRLKGLLRLPFLLSVAWKTFANQQVVADKTQIGEEEFRDIVWRYYVERSTEKQGGMPLKRRNCLLQVSVTRAKRMSLFVAAPAECDPGALQALVDDGVLIESASGAYAPAHDVLEDWAVARFIALEFEGSPSPAAFTSAIGDEPAMRRGFRMWMTSALQRSDVAKTLDFALAAYLSGDVEPVWRDEVAVAILQSSRASQFVDFAEPQLLANDKSLYRRLVHVLRTACKGPNERLLRTLGLRVFQTHAMLGGVFTVPIGSGWAELIRFTHRNLDKFGLVESNVVLGLLKDWSQGLGPELPSEANTAAQICLRYWRLLSAPNVYADRHDKQFLELLFKFPHAAPDEVRQLIRDALNDKNERRYHSRTVLEFATKSFDCAGLCTHFPELVIEVAHKTYFLQRDDDDFHRSSRYDLEELFGLQHSAHFHYFPQSALQGPFPFLLAAHPEVSLEFIINFVNKTTDHYAASEMGNEVTVVPLRLEDGDRPIKASWRLWVLYREMMPGPQVVECALMTLEAWFFNRAKAGSDIREPFRNVLHTTSSAATLGVLASVALAYPHLVGEDALPLLSVPQFIRWDFNRSYQERNHQTDVRPMLGIPTGGVDEIHYNQRKDSAALLHRTSNLEELAFKLQFTSCRDKVWGLLDQYNAALPPLEAQTEEHKSWRVALHRMDIRHFTPEQLPEENKILLKPTDPAPDLKAFIDNAAQEFAPKARRLRLANWGMAVFQGEVPKYDAFPDWRNALKEAQNLYEGETAGPPELALDTAGPIFVAAIAVKDHTSELPPDDFAWCTRVLVEAVVTSTSNKSFEAKVARNPFEGSRPAGAVLPLLLRGPLDTSQRESVRNAIAVAVTHPSSEVRDYAAHGIRLWLWEADSLLAAACVGALFRLASTENEIRSRVRMVHQHWEEKHARLTEQAVKEIRAGIIDGSAANSLSAVSIDFNEQDWPELLDALDMISPATTNAEVNAFVMAVLDALIKEATADEKPRSERRREVSYEMRHGFTKIFARFALSRDVKVASKIGAVLAECVERCPKYLADILGALPYEEDRVRSGAAFWVIWRAVAVPIFNHKALVSGSRHTWRYDELRRLVRILLFADIEWKKDAREWAPVSENKDFIDFAAQSVAYRPAGFGALLSLLNSVGQVFLPNAIGLLADAIRKDPTVNLLADANSMFEAEVLMRRVCYEHGTVVRSRPALHRAALLILDGLVENGSHAGYRLRDFMVTPLPATVH